MSTRKRPGPAPDPANAANKRILAGLEDAKLQRELAKTPELDLGLDMPEPTFDSAADLLRDEFEKKNFGNAPETYTRTVYGPDPLLQACPDLREKIDAIGLDEYAQSTYEAVIRFGEKAVPDPVMRKALARAIAKFDKASVAEAFRVRIMKIPSRQVEVEVDTGFDEVLGRPLDEAVARYGRPGFANKFLSERCMGVLGRRGYQIVKDERGDPVRVGNLIMGEIPQRIADGRRAHYAAQSETEMREQEDSYREKQEKVLEKAARMGANLNGVGALERSDRVRAGDDEDEIFREAGISFARG